MYEASNVIDIKLYFQELLFSIYLKAKIPVRSVIFYILRDTKTGHGKLQGDLILSYFMFNLSLYSLLWIFCALSIRFPSHLASISENA